MTTDLEPYAKYFRPGFLPWLDANPLIYAAFEQQARRLIAAGRDHFSARTILEELRHYTAHRDSGGHIKINDHQSPDLGRAFIVRNPDAARFFEHRRPDWREFLAAVSS